MDLQAGAEPGGDEVRIEVAYALPGKQLIIAVKLPAGTTVADAIELSGIRMHFPDIEAQPMVGIFSRKVSLDYHLQSGDRVEIYRALLADPRTARREKVEQQRADSKKKH